MKYIIALVACATALFLWSVVGVAVFDWKHGGGYFWQVVIWTSIAALWLAIVRAWPDNKSTPRPDTHSSIGPTNYSQSDLPP